MLARRRRIVSSATAVQLRRYARRSPWRLHLRDEHGVVIDAAEVEASSPAGVHRVDRETPCAWMVPTVDCVLSTPSARFAPHVVRKGVGSRRIELVQWEPRRIGVCIVQPERPASGVLVRLRSAADGAVVAVDRDFAARWRSANHQQRTSLFEARAPALRGPDARVPRPATDHGRCSWQLP